MDGVQVIPRLLIVDDEPLNRTLLARVFNDHADIVQAEDGEAALKAINADDFDVVLLDINMPGMNGYEVLARLRERYAMDDLPVILVSARDSTEDIVAGLKAGANDYITKPMNVEIARSRVQAQLRYKRLSDQHRNTIDELRLAQKMQQRFYKIVSHDLKNILTNLRLAHYLLRDQATSPEQVAAILENFGLSLNEMEDLLNIYLDMAALQPGQVEVMIDEFNLKELLRNVVRQYSMAADKKNIRLHYHEHEAEALVIADSRLVSQMISNLVSNALKFSPEGSTAHIWTEPRPDAVHGDKVRVLVADQGPGIPEAERDGLFKMFSRLSPRPTGQESSTGLGLWIVKHLAQLQHGDVGVFPAEDGGSTFWIDIPAGTL